MKNPIEMYCINCGKPIDGDIPLCRDCAMMVIRRQSKFEELTNRINAEAQEFSLSDDPKPESSIGSVQKQDNQIDNREDDQIIYKIVITVAIILILLIVGIALGQKYASIHTY